MSLLTRICLVRHGETEWNLARRLQGQLDIALNALGMRQAEATAAWLAAEPDPPVSAVYSSDLKRARSTAERIAHRLNLPVRVVPELRERRYGVLEGLTHEEARQRLPEDFARLAARDPEYAFPGGGESLAQLSARATGYLLAIAAAHPNETVVVVTHGGVLDAVNRFVRGIPLHVPRDFAIPNAGLNWIAFGADGWRLEAWGQIGHLEATVLDEL